MPKRTAADFAREAPADGPWTFETSDGKVLTPRPRSHYTYAEQQAEANLNVTWGQWIEASERASREAVPVSWEQPESLFMFGLKVRFSAPDVYVKAEDRTTVDLPDFDALWAEVEAWPVQSIFALVRELDDYYPTLASEQEQADAAADPAGDAAGKSSPAAAS